MKKEIIIVPADVPTTMHNEFVKNYTAITHGTGKLMLFAADQKIEHLNEDFYGKNIHEDASKPSHIFEIAQNGRIGALATHLGLIARYGKQFPDINYIAKLNAKTNLLPTEEDDPIGLILWEVENVIKLKKESGFKIRGVAYTLYIGSKYEWRMFQKAAEVINKAHQNGLVTILWVYPRGKQVKFPKTAKIIAGAAGVATSLGADFAKINYPEVEIGQNAADYVKQAVRAAGNTKLLCAGGKKKRPEKFLQELYDQLHIGGTSGNATGKNIFQNSTSQAIAMTKAISSIVLDGNDVKTAMKEL